jgi:hypothetical protein
MAGSQTPIRTFTSGAKARIHAMRVIAALKALRHPESKLFRNL